MPVTHTTPATGGVQVQSVTAGLQTIPQFARDVEKGERTIRRWITLGMPVIRVGATPYIDPAKARAWFEAGMPAPKSPLRRRVA